METYGSPSSLNVYDRNRLIISDIPQVLFINQTVEFTVDVSKAGKGQLEVAINNGQVPNQVQSIENSKFHFTFIPKLNEPHFISVTFNGHQVVGFPKKCQVISMNQIKIRGPSLKPVLLGSSTWFTIDIIHVNLSDLQITIQTPTNETLNPSTLLTSDGLRVDWTPSEVGTYRIHMNLFNNPIPGNPLLVKCYDPKRVIVTPPTTESTIRIPTKLHIDASKAGEGNLEISVNYTGRNIPNEIIPMGNGQYDVQFTPQKSITHYCNILFNNDHVPGSPFVVNVMEAQRAIAIGKGLSSIPINHPTSFTIFTPNDGSGRLKCLIKGSDDRLIPFLITKIDSNRYEVTYTLNRIGEFYIEIFYDNLPIDNSPFIARSFDINQIKVYHFPLTTIADSSTSFIIDAADAGAGSLEIAISRNGKNIPNYVQNEGIARFRIKFIPDQPCMHQVQIKFNNIDIQGSPFFCNVLSSDFIFENYEYAEINKRVSFIIRPKSSFNPNIYCDIKPPSDNVLQGNIEKISMNTYTINFIPNEIGDHEIRFYNDEEKKLIITKFISHVYDPSKIRVSDLPLAITNQLYKFTVYTDGVGHGILSVKIKQNGNKLTHEQTQISTNVYQLSFTPETDDDCIVQISFNGENNIVRTLVVPVKDSCEQVCVSTIPSGVVGRPTIFTIDTADSNRVSILVTESQTSRIVPHTITPLSNDRKRYEISFTPNNARQHIISILYDGKLLSTHQIDVCNVNKIHVSSIDDGIVGQPSIFSVDTHGAGEGHLEVTITNGKGTLPAQLKSIQARKFDIAFIPDISGVYSIVIAFNGIPIEGSPFLMNVADKDHSEEEVDDDDDDYEFIVGGELEGTKVGEVAWVICETPITDLYEDLNICVTDPDNVSIKHTRIQDSLGRWRIEFEPSKEGIHQIKIDHDKTPLNLASLDILPSDYERIIFGECIVYPHTLNFISFISKNENIKVQLKCIALNDIEIPVEMEKYESEWKIYYTLTNIGMYELKIIDNDDQQIYDICCISEENDLFRNGGIDDITRLIIDHKKVFADDVNVIVKDSLAHTIPAAFYRNINRDLVVEFVPSGTGIHEVFIRSKNNLLDICPIRIMAFHPRQSYDPVPRVQVKEILEHTFEGVIDEENKLEICINDPFERPIPFQRSKNDLGELVVSLSPVRVGTHWICISNDENDSFAVLPIFAFDDDYVPLSPIDTPSPNDDKTLRNDNNSNNNNSNSISDLFSTFKELTTISESSEFQSSRLSSMSPENLVSPIQDIVANTFPSDDSPQNPDVTDLTDPCVNKTAKFTFKDPQNKFHITIYGPNGNEIPCQSEQLNDGLKSISYEPTAVGPIEIHILKETELLSNNPLIVHAFDPLAVRVIDLPKKIPINTTYTLHLDPTQAGKGALKITIKDANNQSIPINVEKQSNDHITVQFTPTTSGLHTISILFNRIAIPQSPFQIIVEKTNIIRLPELEQRGRSIYSKHELFLLAKQQQTPNSLSSQTLHNLLSKSNEMLNRQKDSSINKEQLPQQQIIKPEEKPQRRTPSLPFTENDIQRLQTIKEKFERGQPIDIVFDPRSYPFKILIQSTYPLVNNDIIFSIDHRDVAYVQITINGMQVPVLANRRADDTFLLKFRPTNAGDYLIALKNITGQLILSSPLNFPVYNPDGAYLEPFYPLQSIHDCHFICNIDNVGQGKFFVLIYDQSKPIKIPCHVQSISKNRCRLSILPSKIGTYRVYIAYRNIPINGTPIDITVYDSQGISIAAEHTEPVVVRTTIAYKVNTSLAGQGQLRAELIQPQTSINPCRCHIHELNNHEYLIQYVPNEPGRYQLRVLFNNQLVQGKSIETDVYSLLPPPVLPTTSSHSTAHIQKISPHDVPRIGDEVCLQITTDKSPLCGQVSCNGTLIACQLDQIKETHHWQLKFRPYIIGTHKIHLLHNGLPIINSPYLLDVKENNGKNLLSGFTNTSCRIQIRTKSTSSTQIRAVVLLGTAQIPSTLTIVNENLISVNFVPHEPGIYLLNVFNGDQPIQGSPFPVQVTRGQNIQVSGQCFHRLRLHDLGIFRIHCHGQRGQIDAKIFNLSVHDYGQKLSFQLLESYEQLIKFPSKIFLPSLTILLTAQLRLPQERLRNLTLEEKNGYTIVSFQLFEKPKQLPTNEQIIKILGNLIDKQLINLIDPNRRLLHVVTGSLIAGQKGEPVDVKLFPQGNGDYMGEFTPKKVGQHRIDVTFANVPIQDSPFFTEVYDPTQVHIGPLPSDILIGIENTFDINLNNAGNASLEVTITSPSGANVPTKMDEKLNMKKICFIPTETGLHCLKVKYGSDTVQGTPMEIMVQNSPMIIAYGDGIHHALYEKPATFIIDTKDMQGDLKVHIEGANSVIKHVIDRMNHRLFRITFTPVEIGFIHISIKWNGKDINHSPFKVTVTNPDSIRVLGGWQAILDSHHRMHVITHQEKKIHFDKTHAGPGTLQAVIRGEDNILISSHIDQQESSSSSILTFTIPKDGKYDLTLRYAGHLLPNMPIRILSTSLPIENLKVKVYGHGSYEARVNNEAEFTIDVTSGINPLNKKPIVKLIGSQTDIDIRVHQNEKNRNIFHCSYKPTLPGEYLLSIIWAEKEINGSPFKVKVLPNVSNDHRASRVICSGDGLQLGKLGKETKCFIDTRAANPGELTVYCQGIHKTAICRLMDHRDGTCTLFIKPEEIGRHILTIKYNGEHVPGSPFIIKVISEPDASKVHIFGPGIEHGVLSTFQSHFICETKGAGAGQLTVRVRGPKSAFHVEMERQILQDRTIMCRYNPTESGIYLISVKWSGEHVDGSPFHVHIFESQDQLDQYRQQLKTKVL